MEWFLPLRWERGTLSRAFQACCLEVWRSLGKGCVRQPGTALKEGCAGERTVGRTPEALLVGEGGEADGIGSIQETDGQTAA